MAFAPLAQRTLANARPVACPLPPAVKAQIALLRCALRAATSNGPNMWFMHQLQALHPEDLLDLLDDLSDESLSMNSAFLPSREQLETFVDSTVNIAKLFNNEFQTGLE